MDEQKNDGTINAGDVVIFHLISGNAVIGKFVGETEAGLLLSRPCDIVQRRNPKGIIEVGFMPFLSMGGTLPPLEQVVIRVEHILLPRHAQEEMARGYLTATSGIQLASSMPTQ